NMGFFGALAATLSVIVTMTLAVPATIQSTNTHDLITSKTSPPDPPRHHRSQHKGHCKALLKLKLDLCSDVHAKVASGLPTTNIDLAIPKISAKVDSETNAAINTKVELDTQAFVKDKIRQDGLYAIHKHCPRGDDACLRKHTREIVDCIERTIEQDVLHLFVALAVKDLGVNLLLEQINVQPVVDSVAEVDIHMVMCSYAIVKDLHAEVRPHAVSVIKSVCRPYR
ncbi:hypothetical protein BGW39_006081, partial [Mortierella sp. 14UC]